MVHATLPLEVMKPRSILPVATAILAFVWCCAAVGFTLPRLNGPSRRQPSGAAELVYLPQARYLKLMSLGYNNVLADVLWFRTISYFGTHYRSDRTYPWLAHMCELVTDLDPRAQHVYRFAATILPWEAGQADAGIRLLRKGVEALPDSWLLHYWLGFSYYFFQNDFESATKYLRIAARLPDAHPKVSKLAALLAAQHYGPEVTMQFLAEIRDSAYSEEVRQIVTENMRELRLASHLEQLDKAIAAYRERHRAPPPTVAALVDDGWITQIPHDPFGGTYEIDPASGKARSSTGRTPSRLHQSKLRQKHLRGESIRDF
jgi:tetratricopeptide (TPR) repeat protein